MAVSRRADVEPGGHARGLAAPGIAFASLAIALCSCGGSGATVSTGGSPARRATAIYPAKWEPVFRLDSTGRRILSITRSSRRLTLEIVDATCHAHDPLFADVSRRFAAARISELHAAVVITVFMHPELGTAPGCVPAGVGFSRTITLPHPLAARALVDGGDPKLGGGGVISVIRVPATNPVLERQAEAQFGPPDLGPIP
jgi:hypothetical protein